MKAGEGRNFKARIRRELAAKMRKDDRATLRRLRADIKQANTEKREQMRDAVERCRTERQEAKRRAIALREEARTRVREAIAYEKEAARSACTVRKQEIRSAGGTKAARAREALAAERRYQAEISGLAVRAKAMRSTSRERREESIGEVEGNISPDMHAVWRSVAPSIKGSARMSRTEAFLLWAERHPGEVIAMQEDSASRKVEKLIAEQQATQKRVRKGAAGYDRAARAQLEAAPF